MKTKRKKTECSGQCRSTKKKEIRKEIKRPRHKHEDTYYRKINGSSMDIRNGKSHSGFNLNGNLIENEAGISADLYSKMRLSNNEFIQKDSKKTSELISRCLKDDKSDDNNMYNYESILRRKTPIYDTNIPANDRDDHIKTSLYHNNSTHFNINDPRCLCLNSKNDQFLNHKNCYPSISMQQQGNEENNSNEDLNDMYSPEEHPANRGASNLVFLEFCDHLERLEKSVKEINEFVSKCNCTNAEASILIEAAESKLSQALKIIQKCKSKKCLTNSLIKSERYYKNVFKFRNQTSFYTSPKTIISEQDEIEAAKSLTQLSSEYRTSYDESRKK